MGVKCKHYKLCSVQLKLVYFSQFWGMKHFLGPVCDIRPQQHCSKHIGLHHLCAGKTGTGNHTGQLIFSLPDHCWYRVEYLFILPFYSKVYKIGILVIWTF